MNSILASSFLGLLTVLFVALSMFYANRIHGRWSEKGLEVEDASYSNTMSGREIKKPLFLCVTCAAVAGACIFYAILTQEGMSFFGLAKMMTSFPVLAVCALTDLRSHRISNKACLILAAVRLLLLFPEIYVFGSGSAFKGVAGSAAGAVLCMSVLLITSSITHGGIGAGDIKLFSSLGFLCGIQAVLFTMMFSFLLCAIASVFLIILRKKTRKDFVPLGPFIFLGFAATVFLGVG